MKAPKLPAGATGYVVLGVGAIAAIYVIVKYAIPAITNATANAAKNAVNQAATLPAAGVNAAGNAVGSTLDAIGTQVLGASAYNAIPSTWGGVWADVKGWFGGGTATVPSDVTGADTAATTQDQVGAAAYNGTTDLTDTGIM